MTSSDELDVDQLHRALVLGAQKPPSQNSAPGCAGASSKAHSRSRPVFGEDQVVSERDSLRVAHQHQPHAPDELALGGAVAVGGVAYLQKWPSRRAMPSIRGKVRERTARNLAHRPLEQTVEHHNRVVRGWGGYFRYGNSAAKFSALDAYINQRLAILASTRHGLHGWNWTTRFNYEWVTRLGVHRLGGTVKPTTAYASR
jgi:hypothetical protein